MQKSDDGGVSRISLLQDVINCNVAGQFAWALNFDSIIAYFDMYIVIHTVVAVNNCIYEDFFQGFGWIFQFGQFPADVHRYIFKESINLFDHAADLLF